MDSTEKIITSNKEYTRWIVTPTHLTVYYCTFVRESRVYQLHTRPEWPSRMYWAFQLQIHSRNSLSFILFCTTYILPYYTGYVMVYVHNWTIAKLATWCAADVRVFVCKNAHSTLHAATYPHRNNNNKYFIVYNYTEFSVFCMCTWTVAAVRTIYTLLCIKLYHTQL